MLLMAYNQLIANWAFPLETINALFAFVVLEIRGRKIAKRFNDGNLTSIFPHLNFAFLHVNTSQGGTFWV